MSIKRIIPVLILALTLVIVLSQLNLDKSQAQAGGSDKFYQLDGVATIGQSSITDIYIGPSINDQGAVAFVGRTTAGAVFVSDRPGVALRSIAPVSPNTFMEGQF
ncbi:MAG: hypothetical protein ACJ8G2_00740 [Burkholderiales bacterium]